MKKILMKEILIKKILIKKILIKKVLMKKSLMKKSLMKKMKVLMKKILMKETKKKLITKKIYITFFLYTYIKMVNKYYQKKQRKALKRSTWKVLKSFWRRKRKKASVSSWSKYIWEIIVISYVKNSFFRVLQSSLQIEDSQDKF